MEHAWCRDPSRDERVRAAEDRRPGPLPTLKEAIVAPFAEAAERSPSMSKTGDGQSGMRTERVTLEVTHDLDARLSDWIVEVVDESLGLMESVRFVHEPKLAPHANAGGEANHAAQAASGGGEGEPDAWGVVRDGNVESVTHRRFRGDADRVAEQWGETVVPLYRSPPQPRGWLTGEERQNLEEIVVCLDDDNWPHAAAFVRSLLARSTPPSVVLDAFPTDETGEFFSRRDVIAALAAAGVAVKEVGRE